MNIEELVDRFRARANAHTDIETFDFGSLSKINVNRQKKYPVVILTVPTSTPKPFHTNANEAIYEEYNITFHVFKLWKDADKKLISLESIYAKIESIGDSYLRDILQQTTNEYGLIGDKSVVKSRGRFQETGIDPIIGVSWNFTLRVYNCL